ncbi:MAG: hypothetical protein NTU91_01380 [Chloroflexi bacterium]|nr:hypothetical protein [Chloroflexota bacterium]
MSDTPSLSEVQRRTVRLLSYEDGLWDLLLGTIFMLLAVYPITRARLGPAWNMVLFVGLLLLATGVFSVLRRKISAPRLGYVKARYTPALKGMLAVAIALVALTVGLVILTLVKPGWLGGPAPEVTLVNVKSYLVEILVLLALVGLFSAMGYLFGVPRLFLYGWLLGCANLISVILYRGAPAGFNLPLAVAAGVILLIGAYLLVRMLRKYPVQGAEA